MKEAASINPYTGETIARYARHDADYCARRTTEAHAAHRQWRSLPIAERSRCMLALAELLRKERTTLSRLITEEMGKVIGQARAEVDKCAWVCEHYAQEAEAMLQDRPVVTEGYRTYVSLEPLGVLLAVMPWNFPMYQVIRFIAPALMAGNTVVLKHASNVQGCAEALEDLLMRAGFPRGVFSNLNVASSEVEAIIAHDSIRGVSLTGSESAGRAVGELAGRYLKKSVLELGGNDPYIILDDVDLDHAVELSVEGRLQNNGQTCIAAKRFIVLEAIYEDYLSRLKDSLSRVVMGDPLSEETALGPMARHDLRDELHEQVLQSIAQGAKLALGGYIPGARGAFYPATLLTEVGPGMLAFEEELFGPVAVLTRARDEAHALALANTSRLGLGAGVFTSDRARGERLARQIESGNCFVNKLTASDPRLPFGGIKNSGYGRELSYYGIAEFMNIKTLWVE